MFIRSAACLFALMITATASLAQERQWTMDVTETDAFMVFGVPETDDVGVSFWCTLGTPKIKIFVPEGGSDLKPFQTIKFNFEVGGSNFRTDGKTASNEESGGVSVEGELQTNDPFFMALAKQDRFSITAGNHKATYPLDGAEVETFIGVCQAK
jgi:hypothetical protein